MKITMGLEVELFKYKLVLFFYWLHYSILLSVVNSEVRLKNNSFLLFIFFLVLYY